MVQRHDAVRVRSALWKIPAEQRRLIELAYFGGLTQRQMAERCDLPLGTVKTRVRSGLRHLRAILGDA
jgi:RNA polymerase sigma-70 factor (ECF subfamily)